MFGLVFLFAYRKGVFRLIRSHFFQLAMDPVRKETAQDNSELTEKSKDEKSTIDKNGLENGRRLLSLENPGSSSFSTASSSKRTGNPSTASNKCGDNNASHVKETKSDVSGEKIMTRSVVLVENVLFLNAFLTSIFKTERSRRARRSTQTDVAICVGCFN